MGKKTTAGLSLREASYSLATIWFIWGGVILLLTVIMTMSGKLKGIEREGWSWLLSLFVPTLGLIISVLGPTAVAETRLIADRRKIDRRFFNISRGVSIFYLGLISLVILSEPFWRDEFSEIIAKSNLWFSPLQGLVTSIMGFVFVFSSENNEGAKKNPKPQSPMESPMVGKKTGSKGKAGSATASAGRVAAQGGTKGSEIDGGTKGPGTDSTI
jgi:hypothetical protein